MTHPILLRRSTHQTALRDIREMPSSLPILFKMMGPGLTPASDQEAFQSSNGAALELR